MNAFVDQCPFATMVGTSYSMLYLPEVAVEKIFSFLTFDEIAKNRIVSYIIVYMFLLR